VKGLGEEEYNDKLHDLEFLADVLLGHVIKDELGRKFSTNDKYIGYIKVADTSSENSYLAGIGIGLDVKFMSKWILER